MGGIIFMCRTCVWRKALSSSRILWVERWESHVGCMVKAQVRTHFNGTGSLDTSKTTRTSSRHLARQPAGPDYGISVLRVLAWQLAIGTGPGSQHRAKSSPASSLRARALAAHCHELQVLDVTGGPCLSRLDTSSQVTDDGVEALARAPPYRAAGSTIPHALEQHFRARLLRTSGERVCGVTVVSAQWPTGLVLPGDMLAARCARPRATRPCVPSASSRSGGIDRARAAGGREGPV